MRGYFFDGPGHVAEVFGAVGAEGLDVFKRADGRVDLRAFAGDKLEVDPHGRKGEQQVGEDDGGIDAEALGGGNRHLRGNLRGTADVEQAMVLADSHVLRHIATGLTEEPDRRAVDGTTQAGTDETARGRRGFSNSRATRGKFLHGSSLALVTSPRRRRVPLGPYRDLRKARPLGSQVFACSPYMMHCRMAALQDRHISGVDLNGRLLQSRTPPCFLVV